MQDGLSIRFIREYKPPQSAVARAIDMAIYLGISDEELPLFLMWCKSTQESKWSTWNMEATSA